MAYEITPAADAPASFCPYCRASFDAVTGLTGDPRPEAGDAGICWYCGGLLVYRDDGTPREPTEEELPALVADERLRRAQTAVHLAIAKRRRS